MNLSESNREGCAWLGEALKVLLADTVDLATASRLYQRSNTISSPAIREMITSGDIIGYEVAPGDFRLPRWQFRDQGGLVDGIAETLRVLRSSRTYSHITPFVFVVQEHPITNNLTPLEALRKGMLDAVLCAAREYTV